MRKETDTLPFSSDWAIQPQLCYNGTMPADKDTHKLETDKQEEQ